MAEMEKRFRRPSKRPAGRKSVKNILSLENLNVENEDFDIWTFHSLRLFLDKLLNPKTNGPCISTTDALQKNIEFFKKIISDLQEKHKSFEESFAAPIRPHIQFHPVRKQMPRTQSLVLKEEPQETKLVRSTSTRNIKNQDEQPQKHMTSQTIWNTTQKFFGTVPTVDIFKNYLSQVEDKPQIVQLGPHYSIAINQKLRQKFKNETVQIKVPDFLVRQNSFIGNTPIVNFNRIIAALIPVTNIDNNIERNVEPLQKNSVLEFPQNLNDFSIEENSKVMFPTETPGTSYYSKLSFEEKLSLEIASLGLNPSEGDASQTDNEVMNEIMILQEQYKKSTQQTNKLREMISNKLQENQQKLKERNEKNRIWAQMIEKAEKESKSKSKPKIRDKLY